MDPNALRRPLMGGPWHDVWLFSWEERKPTEYDDLLGRKDAPVRIPDDLFSRLLDSLFWIPARNLGNRSESLALGRNRYGVSLIAGEDARRLAHVTAAWCELFRAAPEQLELIGGYVTVESEPGSGYERLQVERDVLIDLLSRWTGLAERASGGSHYLIHLGI